MTPVRYALAIAYDGTEFHGWQKQEPPDPENPGGRRVLRTVQHVVEQALRRVCREPGVVLTGASRTDAGVHAGRVLSRPPVAGEVGPGRVVISGQCGSFMSVPDASRGVGWPASRGTGPLLRALNSELPGDVVCSAMHEVPLAFDPVSCAERKCYTYTFAVGAHRPLWARRVAFYTRHGLDRGSMQAACERIVGTHDFAAFAQISHGRKTTVRTIYECRMLPGDDEGPADEPGVVMGSEPERTITMEVVGSGFLYNMVRIIAGTVLEAGRRRLDPATIPAVLASGDRRRAGPTLPPQGLRLEWMVQRVPSDGATDRADGAGEAGAAVGTDGADAAVE